MFEILSHDILPVFSMMMLGFILGRIKIVSKPVVVNGEVRGAVEDSTTVRKKQEVADNDVDYILDDFVPLFQLELKDDLGKFY